MKVKFIVICASALATLGILFALIPSEKEKEAKHFEELIVMSDTTIVNEAYNGFDYPGFRPYAIKAAEDIISSWDSVFQKKAFFVLEKFQGVDTTALYVFDRYNSFRALYWYSTQKNRLAWNKIMDKLSKNLSDNLNKKVRELVLSGNPDFYDPLWIMRYVSLSEMEKILLNNISNLETKRFLVILPDSIVGNVIKKIPDSIIVEYSLGNRITHQRRWNIANNMPLNNAFEFFEYSNVSEKECRQLILQRAKNVSDLEASRYYLRGYLTKNELLYRFRNDGTKRLAERFESINYDDSEFFHDYAIMLINSVKSYDDYLTAVRFFNGLYCGPEWIELLRKTADI